MQIFINYGLKCHFYKTLGLNWKFVGSLAKNVIFTKRKLLIINQVNLELKQTTKQNKWTKYVDNYLLDLIFTLLGHWALRAHLSVYWAQFFSMTCLLGLATHLHVNLGLSIGLHVYWALWPIYMPIRPNLPSYMLLGLCGLLTY